MDIKLKKIKKIQEDSRPKLCQTYFSSLNFSKKDEI